MNNPAIHILINLVVIIITTMLVTITIELITAILIGIKNKQDLKSICLINCITNPILNTCVLTIRICLNILPNQYINEINKKIIITIMIVIMEITVIFTESNLFKKTIKHNKMSPIKTSLILNGSTILFSAIQIYIHELLKI